MLATKANMKATATITSRAPFRTVLCKAGMRTALAITLALLLGACTSTPEPLPIMGPRQVAPRSTAAGTVADTLYHTVPPFAFEDQFGDSVTQATLADKVYVADFFFVNCPSICPLTTQQMLRVYKAYKDDPRVVLLSHTLAPEFDSVAVLRNFAERLGVEGRKWLFLRSNRADTYKLAQEGYFTAALEDAAAPGGIEHSGLFSLVDTQGHIRGFYDGTDPQQIDQLLRDLPRLLAETHPAD